MRKRFLNKTPKELFWLSILLGVPYYVWLYSIVFELNERSSNLSIAIKILFFIFVGYTTIYFFVGWLLIFPGDVKIGTILPFHYGAMLSGFLLIILATQTINQFEKKEKLKQSSRIRLFLGMWLFFIGIWFIQPKLNEYVKRIE